MEFYATLGPACSSPETLDALFRAGMTGARLNLSHVALADSRPLLEGAFRQVRVQEVRGLVEAGACIIDVREPTEFAEFHLPGAINVPLAEILGGYTPPAVENGAVVVCARGARSAHAVDALARRGVTGLASLRGGLTRFR